MSVEAPGQSEPLIVRVGDAERWVIGRAPDAAALSDAERAILSGGPVQQEEVRSPSVSANHAAVWHDGSCLRIVDLGSKNGTWVRLIPGEPHTLPGTSDVQVRLATTSASNASVAPEPPRYLGKTDFGTNLAEAIRVWFARLGYPVRVWAGPREAVDESPTGVITTPLGNGDLLFVQVERTAEAGFQDRMADVYLYLRAQNAIFQAEESTRRDGMILASPAIREVHRSVVGAALQHLPSLLLLGPSGAGKERLAEAFHRHLGRTGPLVAINCATLNRDRIVADLFGAEAGAYTDAKRVMMGAVERADGGTLFLDELGELPADVQPMLLRFLETGEYQRLGATGRPRFADVKIVGATNRDLRRMVRGGQFREDLFFRLALQIVDVPPLRERFADMAAYLQSKLLGETTAYDALTEESLDVLRGYSWPGNFREAMNFVRRLPRVATRASLDAPTVRRALEAGSLAPVSPAPFAAVAPNPETSPWMEWLRESAAAFMQSTGQDGPKSWSDISVFVEQFLKPNALAHLANVEHETSLDKLSVHRIAEQVKADRGTVTKQLRRYFDERGRRP